MKERDDDDDAGDDFKATFPSNPRGSSRHAPVSKTVAAASGEEDEDSRETVVALETSADTLLSSLEPCKPTRATASTVICVSIAQTYDGDDDDIKGRADLASRRASETPLARHDVGSDDDDDGGEGREKPPR